VKTKQAQSLLFSKPEPALAGLVLLDPDFESGANRQIGNSTTDPRSVSMETKQAKSLLQSKPSLLQQASSQ